MANGRNRSLAQGTARESMQRPTSATSPSRPAARRPTAAAPNPRLPNCSSGLAGSPRHHPVCRRSFKRCATRRNASLAPGVRLPKSSRPGAAARPCCSPSQESYSTALDGCAKVSMPTISHMLIGQAAGSQCAYRQNRQPLFLADRANPAARSLRPSGIDAASLAPGARASQNLADAAPQILLSC